MSENFDFLLRTVLKGLPYTAGAAAGGIALTAVLSFAAGLALLSRSRGVRLVSRVYVEGFRGTSEVVQLFWIYFALPVLVGLQLVPLFAGILVLGLNHGAYGAEIVRGAVQSVPRAQVEGAVALGFGPARRMRRVILPQAVAEMLPPFNNLFIQLLKNTSLLFLIQVPEIFHQGELLRPRFGNELGTVYAILAVLYLVLALLITFVMGRLERIAARRLGRKAAGRDGALAAGKGV